MSDLSDPKQQPTAAQHAERLLRMICHRSQQGPHPQIVQSVLLLAHLEAAGLTAQDIHALARTAHSYARHMESGTRADPPADPARVAQGEARAIAELTPISSSGISV